MNRQILGTLVLVLASQPVAADHSWQNWPSTAWDDQEASEKISSSNYAYVSGAGRAEAEKMLSEMPFVQLTPEAASKFTYKPATAWPSSHIYLVRALSIENHFSDFRVSFAHGQLFVSYANYGSNAQGVPTPLVVSLPSKLSNVYVYCCGAGQ